MEHKKIPVLFGTIALLSLLVYPEPSYAQQWSHVVCFDSYNTFVQTREMVLLDYGLRLNQYMPSAAQKKESELCFLERLASETVDWPEGIRSYLLGLQDILATHAYHLRDADALPQVKEEVVVKLHNEINTATFFNIFNGLFSARFATPRDAVQEPAVEFLGPLDEDLSSEIKLKLRIPAEQWQLESLTASGFESALNQAGVLRISPAQYAELRNKTTSWVIQSNKRDDRPTFNSGFRGEGQTIGLIDDFIDPQQCFFVDAQPIGPNHRKLRHYEPSPPQNASLHGTFVAGIAAGVEASDSGKYQHGQAPGSKIAFDSVYSFSQKGPVQTVLYKVLQSQYRDTARIFSNSWGESKNQEYSLWAYDVDLFSYQNHDALILFSISNEGLIGSPDNSRNALAIGASGQAKFQDIKQRGADGPTTDQRRKPEILAPGCSIVSSWPTDKDNTCIIQRAPSEFVGQELTTCATSWACPAVAGAAALARQSLPSNPPPSGAMIKALLINSTEDMIGLAAKDSNDGIAVTVRDYPNFAEGWGRIQLDNVIASQTYTTVRFDVRQAAGFKPMSPPLERKYRVKTEQGPLKITLAWTDSPPAPTERKTPVVNDLDLLVRKIGCTNGACLYQGNIFDPKGGRSTPLSSPSAGDKLNNVERVILAAKRDEYCVSVIGNRILVPPQGYALVMTGNGLSAAEGCP